VAQFGSDGVVFARGPAVLAGRGVAARIDLPAGVADPGAPAAVARVLGAIAAEGEGSGPGRGPVAHGALPYDRHAPGTLVVPALSYGCDGQEEWVTVVGPADGLVRDPGELRRSLSRPRVAARPGTTGLALTEVGGGADTYRAGVERAVAAIGRGELSKVVLARAVEARFTVPPDPVATLARLVAAEPFCTAFSQPVPGGRFLGASPELLVARRGAAVTAHPLAGTVGLSGDGPRDERALSALAASAKDGAEHRLLVEELAGLLGPRCAELTVPPGPSLVRLGTVAHLATRLEGTLAPGPAGPPPVLELVGVLHPSAAVGGVPRDPALALQQRLEPFARGPWAGPVGWTDARGDGEFVIGIRSALLTGTGARLWAGAGIVAGSEPEAELAETGLKLSVVLDALAPGAAVALSA
jgi:menaquinone-specific isochorismate synthase